MNISVTSKVSLGLCQTPLSPHFQAATDLSSVTIDYLHFWFDFIQMEPYSMHSFFAWLSLLRIIVFRCIYVASYINSLLFFIAE